MRVPPQYPPIIRAFSPLSERTSARPADSLKRRPSLYEGLLGQRGGCSVLIRVC